MEKLGITEQKNTETKKKTCSKISYVHCINKNSTTLNWAMNTELPVFTYQTRLPDPSGNGLKMLHAYAKHMGRARRTPFCSLHGSW